ncbi:MAG TPA: hypothetical protein VFZ66_06240 [Herpetosiphonaceae bacterium]
MKQRHTILRAIQIVVSAILMVTTVPLSVAGSSATALAASSSATVMNLNFDFGSASSPVAAGYQQVTNTMLYTAERGFGIEGTATFRDRGAPDDLRRDFTNGTYGFTVDLPSGDYAVNVISGDHIASNATTVAIEGVARGTISSTTGNFSALTTIVNVADGQMNFSFGRDGRVNAIEIVPSFAPAGLHIVGMSPTTEPSVTIGWDAVDGAASYRIYRALAGQTAFIRIGSSPNTAYTDTSVELGLTYVYTVTQVGSTGIESAQSEPLTVAVKDTTVPAPRAPTGLRIEAARQDTITLAWNAVADALRYYVYQSSAADGPFVKVATTVEPTYADSTTPKTANAYYHVVAVNQGGLSSPSNILRTPITRTPLRQMEQLDRGLVAVRVDGGVLVSWRMLGTDPPNIAFNLYRDGQMVHPTPITSSTTYLDATGADSATYSVRAIVNGTEQASSESVGVWATNYRDIPLQRPADGTTPDGVAYSYRANDASVGDLDGDGQYEIVLKWDPSNSKDNSQAGYTGDVFLDAYTLAGARLWRIGLGKNIRAGAHYTQFLVYDFDGDGRAEVVAKTADGTTDGAGAVIGNAAADYRNASGYILSGPEYLTVFDGATGRALATTNYEPPRGNVSAWGDSYGNRVDRFLAGVAYLDGERPSFVMARGYYTRTVLAAYDWRDGQLTKRWVFDSNVAGSAYAGQGNHNLSVADVDGDGHDEITYGAMAVDDDGTPLYTTGLGHGDAMHLSDLDPARPGLEVFQVHEDRNARSGIEFRDADTGETIWGVFTGQDTGRGVAADVDPRHNGAEAWAISGAWNSPVGGLYTAQGQKLSTSIPPANFAIWWDGDLLREVLDHSYADALGAGVGTIGKWDYQNSRTVNLLTAEGTYSNNGTKGNPSLQADILGDWREEVIWRTEDSSALRLFTTPYVTEHRFTTLMHDPVYRLGIAWQNIGYNQPPHVSYYLGEGMAQPARPRIRTGSVVPASVDIDPDVWNVKTPNTSPRSATLYVELPHGDDVAHVVGSTVRVFADGKAIEVQPSPMERGDYNGNGIPDLMLKVDGRAFGSVLAGYSGSVEVSIIGYFVDGRAFAGSDLVQIVHTQE